MEDIIEAYANVEDPGSMEDVRRSGEAIVKERQALLGYCRGDLTENPVYRLEFGQMTNDRPQEATAVKMLAAAMERQIDRYDKQSHIKIPLPPKYLTDDIREQLEATRNTDLETVGGSPDVIAGLPVLEKMLGPFVTSKAPKALAKEKGKAKEIDADMELEGDEQDVRIVLRPVGGQHRTGAVRSLVERFEKENLADGGALADIETDVMKLTTVLEEEQLSAPTRE